MSDKFKFVFPNKEYKQQAVDYINEFQLNNSSINGTGGLENYLDDYDLWLNKIIEDKNREFSEKRVPSLTYFLIRVNDNDIVGMINIRLMLNENLKQHGGNIGYSIRPNERGKGYNLINLYLGLLVCQENNIKEVLMDCSKNNIASAKTMQHFDAQLEKEYLDDNVIIQDYIIDVNQAILKHKDEFVNLIADELLTNSISFHD